MSADCPQPLAVRDPPNFLPGTSMSCEIAVLPLELLLSLQRSHFHVVGNNIQIVQRPGAGYNVISNGQVKAERQWNLTECIQRKDKLALELSRMFTRLTMARHGVISAWHDGLLAAWPGGILAAWCGLSIDFQPHNDSQSGSLESLKFTVQKTVQSFFSMKEGYKMDGLGLDFTCELKHDSFECTSKIKELDGKILDLSCLTEDEKCKVKNLLDNMSEPNIQINTASEQSPGAVSSLCAGSSEKEAFSSSRGQSYAKRTSVKEKSSTQYPAVNEKSYLLQFTQNLPRYIE
ncbi:uncharacterized protein LOC109934433 [Rhincodon typus]|uniref:uncharacterized protein LOC109934433 n=1 Tax=Rhincodon typus TaxID=259920 RepID=UPI00202E8BBD|nr:uncharacterized protein LOC109934433 [Rhincodon typus]